MGYNKPYAKKCKYCNTVQVIWNEHLEGANKFMEVENNVPHTRDRCEAAKGQDLGKYSPQQQKEFVDSYVPQPQKITPPTLPTETINNAKLDKIIAQNDNLGIAIANISGYIEQYLNNNPTQTDNARLRKQITELEEVIKRQGLSFKPANQIPQEDHDQHVRDMVKKGETDEELEP